MPHSGLRPIPGPTRGPLLVKDTISVGNRRPHPMKYLVAVLGALVVVTGCGSSAGTFPSNASAGPPCRLPIGATAPGLGGFLSYPGGTYAPDSASQLLYNARHQRWFAGPPAVLSPDGNSQLRADHPKLARTTSLVAVDLASGREQQIAIVDGDATPEAWLTSAIYYLHRRGQPAGDDFRWLWASPRGAHRTRQVHRRAIWRVPAVADAVGCSGGRRCPWAVAPGRRWRHLALQR